MRRPTLLALGLAMLLLAHPAAAAPRRILFVGNSFTYGAGSAVWKYRADTVRDLNGEGVGGLAALFKRFADQAGLDYAVSVQTAGGRSLRWHWEQRRALIDQPWDDVVLQDYSTLDPEAPGDDTNLVAYAGRFAGLLRRRNPGVQVRLMATWARADLAYGKQGPWAGRPISAMACDVARGYGRAAAAAKGAIAGVIPVGHAFDRAFAERIADPNPYDGVAFGQVDLWTHDHYHASDFGSYLAALTAFGAITGVDPASLGRGESAARELGLSEDQAAALQRIASRQLAAGTANPRCAGSAASRRAPQAAGLFETVGARAQTATQVR